MEEEFRLRNSRSKLQLFRLDLDGSSTRGAGLESVGYGGFDRKKCFCGGGSGFRLIGNGLLVAAVMF